MPAGAHPIYVSIGVRRRGSENYVWDVPTQLEGQDAVSRKELTAYRKQSVTAAAPANPGARGSFNFRTGVFTPPAGWVWPWPGRTQSEAVWAITATASDEAADGTWGWSREPVGLGPKPTWAKAMAIYRQWMKDTFLPEVVNVYAARNIARIYHPEAVHDRNKEWEVRFSLSAAESAPNDAERKRMIGVCHALEAKVKKATTLAELEAIDYHSATVWRPAAS